MSGKLTDSMYNVLIATSTFRLIEKAGEIGRVARPCLSRIAATSVLRALERRGLVHRVAPLDQWSSAHWGLTDAGRSALSGSAENG